jgi:mRNA interferase RelE/StbE
VRYELIIKPSAEKALDRYPKAVRKRIVEAMEDLRDDPRPRGATKLAGDQNAYRFRIGDYRVVYEIHDDALFVLVFRVAHRKDAYRGR